MKFVLKELQIDDILDAEFLKEINKGYFQYEGHIGIVVKPCIEMLRFPNFSSNQAGQLHGCWTLIMRFAQAFLLEISCPQGFTL